MTQVFAQSGGDQNTSSVSKRNFVFIVGLCPELVFKRNMSECLHNSLRLEQVTLPRSLIMMRASVGVVVKNPPSGQLFLLLVQ